jgi:hypothetical protein
MPPKKKTPSKKTPKKTPKRTIKGTTAKAKSKATSTRKLTSNQKLALLAGFSAANAALIYGIAKKKSTPKAPTPKAPTPKAPTPKVPTPKVPTPKAPTPKAPAPKPSGKFDKVVAEMDAKFAAKAEKIKAESKKVKSLRSKEAVNNDNEKFTTPLSTPQSKSTSKPTSPVRSPSVKEVPEKKKSPSRKMPPYDSPVPDLPSTDAEYGWALPFYWFGYKPPQPTTEEPEQ